MHASIWAYVKAGKKSVNEWCDFYNIVEPEKEEDKFETVFFSKSSWINET